MMWSDEALQGNPNWRGCVAQTGGGCFIQLAVHYIHIFEWVTGARVVRATASRATCIVPDSKAKTSRSVILSSIPAPC